MWTLDTDWRTERTRPNADGSTHQAADPMRREPAPRVSAPAPSRAAALAYRYDWLGNMTSWQDPGAQAFHERELGGILNGSDTNTGTSVNARPSALYMASDLPTGGTTFAAATDRGGYLNVQYGEGGNVEALTVHGQCRDVSAGALCTDPGGTDADARAAHLRTHCACMVEQHYQYRWDEVNRLAEARRYDREGAGSWSLAARQRYAYDAGNQRTVKQTLDPTPRIDGPSERVALYVLPGEYERVGVRANETLGRYEHDADLKTESQYLVAGARVVWKPGQHSGSAFDVDKDHRVVVAYTNLVQSTTSTQDLATGLLVEQSTFIPNGARETLRSQNGGSVQGEVLGFTGKESDDEIGLVCFGVRCISTHIARWITPDPLSVHAMSGGEYANSYHYVKGRVATSIDPDGSMGYEPDFLPITPQLWRQIAREHGFGSPDRRTEAQRVGHFFERAVQAAMVMSDARWSLPPKGGISLSRPVSYTERDGTRGQRSTIEPEAILLSAGMSGSRPVVGEIYVEAKSTDGPITLDGNRGQMRAYIDHLSRDRSNAGGARPTLLLVLMNQEVRAEVIQYAQQRGVALFFAGVLYNRRDDELMIGPSLQLTAFRDVGVGFDPEQGRNRVLSLPMTTNLRSVPTSWTATPGGDRKVSSGSEPDIPQRAESVEGE